MGRGSLSLFREPVMLGLQANTRTQEKVVQDQREPKSLGTFPSACNEADPALAVPMRKSQRGVGPSRETADTDGRAHVTLAQPMGLQKAAS